MYKNRTLLAGSVMTHPRVVDREVTRCLSACRTKACVDENLDCDYVPRIGTGVLCLTADDIMSASYPLEPRMSAIAKYPHPIVLYEHTSETAPRLSAIQWAAATSHGASVVCYTWPLDAARLLAAMVGSGGRVAPTKAGNPVEPRGGLAAIRGVGAVRTAQALDECGSIQNVAMATREELVERLGNAAGQAIYRFFNDPLT